jgi:hypothetical protein
MNVRRVFEKLRGSALAQKLGIKAAPAIPASKPKVVQAIVNADAGFEQPLYHRLPPKAKSVVRVLAAQKQTWIKKL